MTNEKNPIPEKWSDKIVEAEEGLKELGEYKQRKAKEYNKTLLDERARQNRTIALEQAIKSTSFTYPGALGDMDAARTAILKTAFVFEDYLNYGKGDGTGLTIFDKQ